METAVLGEEGGREGVRLAEGEARRPPCNVGERGWQRGRQAGSILVWDAGRAVDWGSLNGIRVDLAGLAVWLR